MAALGEVLRKVTLDIYADLNHVLLEMRSQDKELRTSVMKLFIVRTKRKLAQSFAITRWLSFNGIAKSLQSVNELKINMSAVEARTGQKLDELFFTHATVYSLRSRPLEVAMSSGVLSSGQYDSLPTSIFTCGLSETPVAEDVNVVVSDLNIYIRSKLAICDPIPSKSLVSVAVENGVLKVALPYFFELFLTLQQLSAESRWNLLGFRILAEDHPLSQRATSSRLDFAALESSSLLAARRLVEANSGGVAILHRLLRLCRHSSIAANLRLLYRQAVESSAAQWKGALLASLDEASSGTQLNVCLWRSVFSKEFQLVLRIEQARPFPSAHNGSDAAEGLQCSLVVPSQSVSGKQCIDLKLDALRFVDAGAHFQPLLEHALLLCSVEKLKFLAARLSATLQHIGSELSKKYQVALDGVCLTLGRSGQERQQSVALTVEVDVRSGKYLLDSTQSLGALTGEFRREFELFLTEINNVQAEELFVRRLGDQATQSAAYTATLSVITTLGTVLHLLELGWWHHLVLEHAAVTAVPSNALGAAAQSEAVLVYSVASWISVDDLLSRTRANYSAVFSSAVSVALGESGRGKKRSLDEDKEVSAALAGTPLAGLYMVVKVDQHTAAMSAAAVFRSPSGDKERLSRSLALHEAGSVTSASAGSLLTSCLSRAADWAVSILGAPAAKRSRRGQKVEYARVSSDRAVSLTWTGALATVLFLRGDPSVLDKMGAGSDVSTLIVCRLELLQCGESAQMTVQSLELAKDPRPNSHKMACEVFLHGALQTTLDRLGLLLGPVQMNGAVLMRWAADSLVVVDALAHCVETHASCQLRPVQCAHEHSSLSVLLAVHRLSGQTVGDGELCGYVELLVENSDRVGGEGNSVKASLRDLAANTCVVLNDECTVNHQLQLTSVDICKKCSV